MAITKVGAINTIPTTTDDWTNSVKHLNAFINQVNMQAFILSDPLGTASPTIKQGCYINHGGTLYIVDTSDYAPSGSPADGNVYIKLTPSGNTLVGSFITDISSYSYSQQYGNMVSGTDMILPYLLVKSGASWTKYRYQPMSVSAIKGTSADFTGAISGASLGVTGAISGASIDTGHGAVELYPLIFESVSVTATSADATVTISPLIIGQEVLVTATLTSANNYTAYVALPSGSEKYSVITSSTTFGVFTGVVIGGTNISLYSIISGTPATVTRNILVKRLS